jgi:hypothetical protein
MSQRQPQQLVPGMQPAVLTMDSLLRAAQQTSPQVGAVPFYIPHVDYNPTKAFCLAQSCGRQSRFAGPGLRDGLLCS